MPKRKRSSKVNVGSSGGSFNPEDIAERLNVSQLSSMLGGDLSLRTQKTVPSSDDIVTYELLKKAVSGETDNEKLVKEFEDEDLEFLLKGMKMIKEDVELQYMFGGKSMSAARALASILKKRARDKEIEELFDARADEIIKDHKDKRKKAFISKFEVTCDDL